MSERAPAVSLTCPRCGVDFAVKPSHVARRVYCSRACQAEALSERQPAERTGEANPNFRHGKRAGAHSRGGARRFQSGQERCQHPSCPSGGLALVANQHHVVYEQHVRQHGGDRFDARNALGLCWGCHSSHHRRGRVVPITALRDENIEFAFELLGAAAYDYLRRYYEGNDPRIERALTEAA